MESDKFDAAAGKHETCRLPIRDAVLATVEVVSCSAAVVLRRYDEHSKGFGGARRTAAGTRSYEGAAFATTFLDHAFPTKFIGYAFPTTFLDCAFAAKPNLPALRAGNPVRTVAC